jgi:hypothetical protein
MPRRSSNPLPSWKQGVDPDQSGPEIEVKPNPFEQQLDPLGVEFLLMTRAVNIVRRRYGIEAGDFSRWTPRHDREAIKVLEALRQGKPVDRHQYIPPPPINPLDWIQVRQASR